MRVRRLPNHGPGRTTRAGLPVLALLVLALLAAACGGPATPARPAASGFSLHPFPGLESRMPHTVAGKTLQTTSLRPSAQTASPKTLALLARLGKTVDDLQLATASLPGEDIAITALRIKGFDEHKTLAAVQAVDEADPQHITAYGTATVGGKLVVTRTVGGKVTTTTPRWTSSSRCPARRPSSRRRSASCPSPSTGSCPAPDGRSATPNEFRGIGRGMAICPAPRNVSRGFRAIASASFRRGERSCPPRRHALGFVRRHRRWAREAGPLLRIRSAPPNAGPAA